MARVPKTARGKISLVCGIYCCSSSFFISFAQPASVYCEEYVYICIHTHVHTHARIYDCVETVYELLLLPKNTASERFLHKSVAMRSIDWMPLLPKNTASERFLHKSVAIRSVDWIFITGASSLR
jgi:hypothetical protein